MGKANKSFIHHSEEFLGVRTPQVEKTWQD